MGFRYHVESLERDVSERTGCLFGSGNVAAIKAKIEERKRAAVEPEVEQAVDALGNYFDELLAAMGEDGRRVLGKQELEGVFFDEDSPEAKILDRIEAQKVKTTISLVEAKHLAKLIRERTADWGDSVA